MHGGGKVDVQPEAHAVCGRGGGALLEAGEVGEKLAELGWGLREKGDGEVVVG